MKNINHREKGQGLVEYGLILALVSVVAVGAIGGVGDKVMRTFNIIESANEHALIEQGFIPIASADELDRLRIGTVQRFGIGTEWEGEYSSGLDGHYILVNDLDLSGYNWEPIGGSSNAFSGEFDGGGHTIRHLTINRPNDSHLGLFGFTLGSQVRNVHLESGSIRGYSFIGSLIGMTRGCVIENTSSDLEVVGSGQYTGGLIGDINGVVNGYIGSKVTNSYSTGDVTGRNYVGGFSGWVDISSEIYTSYATGDVLGDGGHIGGFIGRINTLGLTKINHSYSAGKVYGSGDSVGGFIGSSDSGLIEDSAWDQEKNSTVEGIGVMESDSSSKRLEGLSTLEIKKRLENLYMHY